MTVLKRLLQLGASARGWGRLAGLLLAVFLLAVGIAWASTSTPPSIWIDAPLDGSSIPLGVAVGVIGHAGDTDGIAAARLEVDGVQVATSETPVAPGSLATLRFEWVPDAPGVHTLGLWVKPTSDAWAGPALATVEVVEEIEATTTTTSTTICIYGIPEPASPVENHVFSKTGIAMSVPFTWSYTGCAPSELAFHIQLANDPSFADGTVIWNTTVSSQNATSVPIACADYWWRVRVRAPVVGEWSAIYAFIVQDACP